MYKTLQKDFFQNIQTQKNARNDSEVIPFQFSEKVLKGESRIKVNSPKNRKNV